MSTATCIWIAARASRWPRPAIRIPTSSGRSPSRRRRFLHISTDYYHEPQVRAGRSCSPSIAPVGGRAKTFFSNSGTEAVEAAIKLARYHTKRFNIIAFLGSFHGRTLGSLSLTSSRTVQRRGFGPMAPGVFHAPYAEPLSMSGWQRTRCRAAARASASRISRIRSSRISCRPTRSPRSSSSPYKARAGMSSRRRSFFRGSPR